MDFSILLHPNEVEITKHFRDRTKILRDSAKCRDAIYRVSTNQPVGKLV
ncbi:MAG: hypothetical protein WBF90_37925 [Rivularia sp. (in: cyanobacteria)]|jgi:hypothetical protein